jgi:hypothetical protein
LHPPTPPLATHPMQRIPAGQEPRRRPTARCTSPRTPGRRARSGSGGWVPVQRPAWPGAEPRGHGCLLAQACRFRGSRAAGVARGWCPPSGAPFGVRRGSPHSKRSRPPAWPPV